MIWMQSRSGRAIDMIRPRVEDICFREIADALSHLNRYAGHSEKPVSAALHTLILFDAAEERDRAYALLHDAHAAYIGEVTTPAAEAIAEIAAERFAATAVMNAIEALRKAHDAAIFAAAGVPEPSAETRKRIRLAGRVATQTERRDFLAPSRKPWRAEIERAAPLRKRYRFRAPPDVADELYARFKQYLPALAAPRLQTAGFQGAGAAARTTARTQREPPPEIESIAASDRER
jgi:hypothetical protein